jgi:hypothetical protein
MMKFGIRCLLAPAGTMQFIYYNNMSSRRSVHKDNPFRTSASAPSGEETSSRRSVDVGLPGETPKKCLAFDYRDPPADLHNPRSMPSSATANSLAAIATDHQSHADNCLSPNTNPAERPKTGRGKAHPTPDDFFDYVVPSPDSGKHRTSRLVIHPACSSTSGNNSAKISTPRSRSSSSTRLAEDNYLLGINVDGVSREKQIKLLGCWLFGSALKI